jgi:hypothetical protein
VNQSIADFNTLTSAGGGSPFYCAGVGEASVAASIAAGCTQGTTIANPYYNNTLQSLVTINGWYPGAGTSLSPGNSYTQGYYDAPWNGTLLLNWRKNKLAITPSFQLTEGGSYGAPLDTLGLDPRTCFSNQNTVANGGNGVVTLSPNTNPYSCDWVNSTGLTSNVAPNGRLWIPNPATGNFNTPGQYRDPWELGANLAITYDISPKVKANLTIANLYHTCFGGSTAPWTALYPPGKNVCFYGANGAYVSNVYEGTSMFDTAANGLAPQPWQQQPYNPGSGGVSIPMNLYFSVDIKL